jgi:hypothetical protein
MAGRYATANAMMAVGPDKAKRRWLD